MTKAEIYAFYQHQMPWSSERDIICQEKEHQLNCVAKSLISVLLQILTVGLFTDDFSVFQFPFL